MLAYHVSRWRHEPCINVSKLRAMQGARTRAPVARASCVRARGNTGKSPQSSDCFPNNFLIEISSQGVSASGPPQPVQPGYPADASFIN